MKINIKEVEKVYVQNGDFDTDLVFALTFIKALNQNIKIVRTKEIINGLCFDKQEKMEYINYFKKKDKHGVLYSLTSMLWEQYGQEYLKGEGFSLFEKAYEEIYGKYIKKISIGTRTGFKNVKYFSENKVIENLNLKYYEVDPTDYYFQLALDFAGISFESWIRQCYCDIELDDIETEIWENAAEQSKDGIYILEENIYWKKQLKKHPESDAKVIITKDVRGGYKVVSKDVEELVIAESEYLSFLHNSKFMGIADTLEYAILAAKNSISKAMECVI